MFELDMMKSLAIRLAKALCCHRAIYAGLACCHGYGCILTDKPELYGPIAFFYAVLSARG